MFFYNNQVSRATLTVTSGVDYDLLTDTGQKAVWKSTSIDENIIKMTFDSDTPIKGMVALNHNLVSGDTFLFEASSDDFSTTAQSIAVDPGKGYVTVDWNYRYYRLKLQKTAGDCIQAAEIYLAGSIVELTFEWGFKERTVIKRISNRAIGGRLHRKTLSIHKEYDFTFSNLTNDKKEAMDEMGKSDFICFAFPGTDEVLYGGADIGTFTGVNDNCWEGKMVFMENPK